MPASGGNRPALLSRHIHAYQSPTCPHPKAVTYIYIYITVSVKTIHSALPPFLQFRAPCCCCATAANISWASASFSERSAAPVAAAL